MIRKYKVLREKSRCVRVVRLFSLFRILSVELFRFFFILCVIIMMDF